MPARMPSNGLETANQNETSQPECCGIRSLFTVLSQAVEDRHFRKSQSFSRPVEGKRPRSDWTALSLKARPEHSKARCEDQGDGKHYIEKLIPPARWKITTKQQPKGFRMIVEDHDMSDRFFAFGDGSRRKQEDSLLSQRCGVRQSVGSSDHHSFLKRSKIDISQNIEELLNRGYW
jgi:hypothetical protein